MAACANCGTAISAGDEVAVPGQGTNAATLNLCSTCAYTLERTFQEETESPNLAGAVLMGFAAALVASVVWYGFVVLTKYQVGFVAIAVGWLVGQAAVIGAGRKRGPAVQAVSVLVTLAAMGFSEFLIVRHFAVEAFAKEGITDIPWVFPPEVMLEIIVDSLKSDPLTILFWAIALWQAYRLPASRRLARTNG